jgi:hypothetical protein
MSKPQQPYHLAEINAARIDAEHRANVLHMTLKNSVALLKDKGVDVSEFTKILKEYKK